MKAFCVKASLEGNQNCVKQPAASAKSAVPVRPAAKRLVPYFR